jgi:hypothetical protein
MTRSAISLMPYAMAEAVALGGGVVSFTDARQRPNVFIPGLEAKPWWDAAGAEFASFVPALEAAAPAMRAEVIELLRDRRVADPAAALSYSGGMAAGDVGVRLTECNRTNKANGNNCAPGWRKVVGSGAWREIVLYGGRA